MFFLEICIDSILIGRMCFFRDGDIQCFEGPVVLNRAYDTTRVVVGKATLFCACELFAECGHHFALK